MIVSSNRFWVIGTVILAAALIALGWLLGISPKLTEGAASDVQRLQVDVGNQQQSLKVAQMKADFENLATISGDLQKLETQLPSSSDYPAFLGELNTLAGAKGVTVTNVAFDQPTLLVSGAAGAAAAAATPATATSAAPAGSVVTIGTKVTMTGSFADLQSAVGAMQAGSRLFLVSGMSFSTSSVTSQQSGGSGAYSVIVSGLLYVLTDGKTRIEEAPAAPVVAPTSTPAPTATP